MKKIAFLVLIFLSVYASHAVAHKVNAYAYREKDNVVGECYFVDGSPCKNSKVEIYDGKGNKIAETITDERGRFAFKTEAKGELRLVILAGEGHRAEYRVEALEKPEKRERAKNEPAQESKKAFQTSINREELREIVDEAIDTKLQGLKMEMMDIRKQLERIALRDVIGGIGYIFGVWGIIMLIKRKKNAS